MVQQFEIQMSTLVLFISEELLLRKVVDGFQKPRPASCGDSYCQIDCAYQCVEFVLIMTDTLTLAIAVILFNIFAVLAKHRLLNVCLL